MYNDKITKIKNILNYNIGNFSNKSGQILEIAKLRAEILSCKSQINTLYCNIGERIYKKHKRIVKEDKNIDKYFKNINELENKIKKLKKDMQNIKK
jgi:uncharacterized coiled-coil DUF342 family protein